MPVKEEARDGKAQPFRTAQAAQPPRENYPRTFQQLLSPFCFLLSLALVVAFLPSTLVAQQRGKARTRRTTPPAAQIKDAERARRARAVDLLIETADAARTFDEFLDGDDLLYRARVQALVADALWPVDSQRARAIFRRAWDAATAADKAEQETETAEYGVSLDSGETFITVSRDEVLAKVAACDPQLAGRFLREYLSEKSDDKSVAQNRASRRTPWREPSRNGARRLALALDLLNRNEPARAAQIVAPVINEGVSGDLMAFILRLREQSASDADALYLNLLKRTRVDVEADANSILLLSSPLISPELMIVVDQHGSLQFRPVAATRWNRNALLPVSNAARSLFYNVAATVLLRPIVPRPDVNTMPEAVALYFAIGRLVAHFEREAVQYATPLRARSGALLNEIEAARRDQLSAQFELTSLTPQRAGDPLRPQVEQMARAGDTAERDRIALAIVRKAAQNRFWDRAKRAAAEIEDTNVRHAALSFIAVSQIADLTRAYSDDKEKDFEGMARFVTNADVPPLAAAWGMAQSALIASQQGKQPRAVAFLDEAERYAERVERGARQRVAAYAVVASHALRVDKERAWRLLPEVVTAANAVKDYAGDEARLDIGADEPSTTETAEDLSIEADVFRLDRIFAIMARLDFEKAVVEARALQGKVPRAFAHLAIARAALDSKTTKEKDENGRQNTEDRRQNK